MPKMPIELKLTQAPNISKIKSGVWFQKWSIFCYLLPGENLVQEASDHLHQNADCQQTLSPWNELKLGQKLPFSLCIWLILQNVQHCPVVKMVFYFIKNVVSCLPWENLVQEVPDHLHQNYHCYHTLSNPWDEHKLGLKLLFSLHIQLILQNVYECPVKISILFHFI